MAQGDLRLTAVGGLGIGILVMLLAGVSSNGEGPVVHPTQRRSPR